MERDQALKFMHDLLRLMLQKNGSDLFITAGFRLRSRSTAASCRSRTRSCSRSTPPSWRARS
jgi:Tfp pilus assembly ATPase PilU